MRPASLLGLGMALAVAATVSSPWTYPLRLLGVAAHELAHAAAAVLTGGEVVEIAVSWDESGHALTRGGASWVVLNAGYLGAFALGRGLVALGGVAPRAALGTVSLALLAATWWSPWSIARLALGCAAASTAWCTLRTAEDLARPSAQALGLFVACHAVGDAASDFARGDAALLAERTWVPAVAWSLAWVACGTIGLVHWAWTSARRAVRREGA